MAGLTRAQLRTRVQNKGYGTDVASVINDAINDAQDRVLAIRRWSFLETVVTEALVADTSEVPLTDLSVAFSRIDAVRLFEGEAEFDMRWMDPQEFRRRDWIYQDEASGPFNWTRYAEKILLQPATDRAYTLQVEGMALPTELDDDADATLIPREYSQVLVWGAVSALCFRERDWAGRQVAEEQFAKHLNAMLTEYVHEQRQNAGEVARWDGWNEVGGGRLM